MIDETVSLKPFVTDRYVTPDEAGGFFSKRLPNLFFYARMCAILKNSADCAKAGRYNSDEWMRSSVAIRSALEKSGVRMTIEGVEHFSKLNGPCVFVGNHMSTLETFVLPGVIRPFTPLTFVVKEGLLRYPVFEHVMRAREPIAVERKDPRADFARVMQEGVARLGQGVSVIIFPQSTRRLGISRQHFNSLGIKLARKANVPVVPVALRTDAWGMGGLFGLLKDHGAIRPRIPVNIRFGAPLAIQGNGKEEHEQVFTFIENCLREWGMEPDQSHLPPVGKGLLP